MTMTRTPAANRFKPIDPQPDDAPPMPNQTDKTLAPESHRELQRNR
jgi:hypothetical protein